MTGIGTMARSLVVRHGIGSALVALQFSLLAVLAWLAAPSFLAQTAPVAAWLLLLTATALGLWALHANRPGNFNIRPAPREGGELIHHGPYRRIRHPMYTSVGGFGACCAVAAGSAWSIAAAVLLVGVLLGKALIEEQWMSERHPGYAAYQARSWRFLPGIH
jgi:protein-S-isoprenylcysteine O-methyltransferase Ste14